MPPFSSLAPTDSDTVRHIAQACEAQAFDVYRRAFMACPDSVTLSRLADGTYIDVNPGFEMWSGYSREEAVGRSSVALGLWPSAEDRSRFVRELRRSGSCHGFISRMRRRGGAEPGPVEMSASITRVGGEEMLVCVMRDVHAARAQPDRLTGLPNRVLLLDRLAQEVSRAERSQDNFSVLLVDLDGFARVNDALGHAAGDALLQEAAARIGACVRKSDTVARWGGDRFVIIAAEGGIASHAARVAQKVVDAFVSPFIHRGGSTLLSASIGVAVYPTDGRGVDELLQSADAALRHAKAQGGRVVQFHNPQIQQSAQHRLSLESDLRRALAQRQFVLFYQPQVDMRSGRVLRLEALVRWRHPERGLLAPKEFISLAEESGLIVPLGEWILREACRQLREWRDEGHASLCVAVNLSPRQIWGHGFVDVVRAALREAGLAGDALAVEITESLLMRPTPENAATLERLAAIGLRLHVDDFGTGYSSLAFLQSYPIHALKIDPSFVGNIIENPRSLAIASSIIAMARQLGLDVIAEGVETQAQARKLLEHGCTTAQGFFYARTASADAIGKLLGEPAPPRSVNVSRNEARLIAW